MSTSRNELIECERLIGIRIMQEDAESIYSLLQTERNPIFAMEIIPYYALFVQSYQEYMGEDLLPKSIAKDLKDIRNHIKAYTDGFGKSQKCVVAVDDAQDRDFKEQLRFRFLKKFNIHLNLGTYWTEEKQIIGNTQQLANSSSFPIIERERKSISINYYCDINTNKTNNLLLKGQKKEINLFYLHLLCNMNFVKYILRPLFRDGNIWVFRVEYIVSYHTLRALERLKNYTENNENITIKSKEIHDILKLGELLFKTKVRNCMMHYNLENAGVISFENIDKPFYGIIENCFDGKSYQEYLIELHRLSNMIIDF